MNETLVTVVGNVVTPVTMRVTATGTSMATFRLASTPRRFDREHNTWRDGMTSFYSVTCWRALAENAHASLDKGQPVLVVGRQRVRPWTADDGRSGLSVELDAVALGHDLTRCRSQFEKVRRGQGGDVASQASAQALAELAAQPTEDIDPWTGEIRTPIPAGAPWPPEPTEPDEPADTEPAGDVEGEGTGDGAATAKAAGRRAGRPAA